MQITKVKVRKVTKLPKKEDVYNMEVEEHHNFAVNGGYIVHNCIDATRYAMERIFKRRGQ